MKKQKKSKMIITEGQAKQLVDSLSNQQKKISQYEEIKKKYTKMTGRYYVDYDKWEC